ncbi:hypothetical protein ACFQU2_23705 [Siccirubricoccus deserti]
MTMTLAELLAPVTPEQFFTEYHDRKPLCIRGGLANSPMCCPGGRSTGCWT